MLAKINSLKCGEHWSEASGIVDQEFQKLTGLNAAAAMNLSETELLARLIKGEPTQAVREKTLILTALFKEAGGLALGQGRAVEGGTLYLKGLHLLLAVLAREELFEFPDFVPRVEAFLAGLEDSALPLETQARLMQHYERLGEFAKAENSLFAMLDLEPDSARLAEFGIAFYERLSHQSDDTLAAGNLPRAEIEAGLIELKSKLHNRRLT